MDDTKNQSSGSVISKIELVEDGRIEFPFSDLAAPYILNYTKLLHVESRELSMIKSKYTASMLRLIEAKRFGDRNTVNIEGTVERI